MKEAFIKDLTQKNNQKDQEIIGYQKTEQMRHDEYDKRITELNALREQLNQDRLREQKAWEEEIEAEQQRMRQIWKEHEKQVESTIKMTAQKLEVEYIEKEKLPFSGKPDNTIRICNEYVLFDAKSPGNKDLSNFPNYLKNQAELAKKYLHSEVHRIIFLVIPINTIDHINEIHYNMAEYQVYIITPDAIEPIIQLLKRIEAYDTIKDLDPEDRENICRIIGKFAHASKRRIQIDNYFCNEFNNILENCNHLPDEIISKTKEYEKADKMNPPIEKRAREIRLDQLKKDVKRLKHGCESQDINVKDVSETINKIPLEINDIEDSIVSNNCNKLDQTLHEDDVIIDITE